ncbi:DUF1016 N-terminal domain-containing protein [uncultured Polaribacter sp.]|uniref:DUF1016 N-terminal domain-containing protein n=1 Tax=uncultured Polaribacter sp. TaxID=174711 RepID=UPI002633B896|nr:DUF1016 N-terminal domain-containing protein [uncultured Polaribacter sp.]
MSKEVFLENSEGKSQVFCELKTLIEQNKQHLSVLVNSSMSLLYWEIGKRINGEILLQKRAEYGKQIVETLANQLTQTYGKGWSEKQLRHCLRIAEIIDDKEILYALSRELSWTHLRALIYIKEPIKRSFYIEMCKIKRWSTRTLQERINSMFYERKQYKNSRIPYRTS